MKKILVKHIVNMEMKQKYIINVVRIKMKIQKQIYNFVKRNFNKPVYLNVYKLKAVIQDFVQVLKINFYQKWIYVYLKIVKKNKFNYMISVKEKIVQKIIVKNCYVKRNVIKSKINFFVQNQV